ncbi:MAG: NAD(+)/NADH kinase [Dethiobacter sp.]|nr:NAD(+)/NADH kinase [Dethiobacter sp.]
MKAIGLVANWHKKQEVLEMVRRISEFFTVRQISVYLSEHNDTPGEVGVESIPLSEFPGTVDIVIVLGGDGTILRVARELSGKYVPILGVNLGQMGFLAEVEPVMLEQSLEKLLTGSYEVRHRLMLSARVLRDERPVAEYTALNDIVISKGPFSRIIYVDTFVNNKPLESYPGDGIIVSTPTGSTGYSLSAGGPIVNPALDVMIITPICPHLLHHRSVVVASSERVLMKVRTRQAEVVLTVDGQVGFTLQDGDVVVATRAPLTTPLIQLEGTDFYMLLHSKLMKVIRREPERV